MVLALSAPQTKTDACANKEDPEEMAHKHRIYTVRHSVFDFRLKLLFAAMDMSKFKDGKVHFRNLGMKGLILMVL